MAEPRNPAIPQPRNDPATSSAVVCRGPSCRQSWFQLLIATVLGILFTQCVFLALEAALHQVFVSGPANDRTAKILGRCWWA